MPKLSAISRLISGLKREYHDYKPSSDIFPALNPNKVASDLELHRLGIENAGRNHPPADSTSMDNVEIRIIDRIEEEKNTAHNTYSEEVRVYAERLAGLEFEERFNAIQNAAPAAVSEFKVAAAEGRDELTSLRRTIKEVEAERDAFRKRHRIDRVSRHSMGGHKTLKFGILVVLLIAEVVMNGVFLSSISDDGIAGGIVEASAFAFLNVVGSFLVAAAGIRWINHRNLFRKLVGILSLAFYVGFAIWLNLLLAHYREIAETLTSDASRAALTRVVASPMGLEDLKSWILFGIGLSFSGIAVLEAFMIYDPYPGFGQLYERVEREHTRYRDAKKELFAKLEDILNDAVENMEEAGKDLSRRRGAYDSYMQGRERLDQLFIGYQDHLERNANTLLSMYREANQKARTDGKVPDHFGKRYKMERVPVSTNQGVAMARDDLRKALADAHELLNSQVVAIHAVFAAEVATYKQLDDLVPENDDAPQIKVA